MQDKIKEIIILCGGQGTRLRSVLKETPKILAPIGERTFLDFLISIYLKKGIEKFIFSMGFMHERIIEHLEKNYAHLTYQCIKEEQPLGTGGAIVESLKCCNTDHVIIANGDSFAEFSIHELWEIHIASNNETTILVTSVEDGFRYGTVVLDSNRIISFKEKGVPGPAWINAGVYLIDKDRFLNKLHAKIFSFEHEYLMPYAADNTLHASLQTGYFIDIGIPEDLLKAQYELDRYA